MERLLCNHFLPTYHYFLYICTIALVRNALTKTKVPLYLLSCLSVSSYLPDLRVDVPGTWNMHLRRGLEPGSGSGPGRDTVVGTDAVHHTVTLEYVVYTHVLDRTRQKLSFVLSDSHL